MTLRRSRPRDVTAELTHDGILISWQWPSAGTACAGYDIERVPGTQTVTAYIHPRSGYRAWKTTETGGYYKYTCDERRYQAGFEIYRTSYGYVYRDEAVELLSDSQPYLVGTVINDGLTLSFLDTSGDALVGLRTHHYQVRVLYGADEDFFANDRDFGGRLSAGTWIEREHDAAQPDARSPQNLTVSIPTKQAVADGATLASFSTGTHPHKTDPHPLSPAMSSSAASSPRPGAHGPMRTSTSSAAPTPETSPHGPTPART